MPKIGFHNPSNWTQEKFEDSKGWGVIRSSKSIDRQDNEKKIKGNQWSSKYYTATRTPLQTEE